MHRLHHVHAPFSPMPWDGSRFKRFKADHLHALPAPRAVPFSAPLLSNLAVQLSIPHAAPETWTAIGGLRAVKWESCALLANASDHSGAAAATHQGMTR